MPQMMSDNFPYSHNMMLTTLTTYIAVRTGCPLYAPLAVLKLEQFYKIKKGMTHSEYREKLVEVKIYRNTTFEELPLLLFIF